MTIPLIPASAAQVLGGYDACHDLFLTSATAAAASPDSSASLSGRQILCQLHHLGLVLGVELWAQDYRDHTQRHQARRRKQQRGLETGEPSSHGGSGVYPADTVPPVGCRSADPPGPAAAAAAAGIGDGLGEHTAASSSSSKASAAPSAPPPSQGGADGRDGDGGGGGCEAASCRAVVEGIRLEEFGLGDGSDGALGAAGLRLREVQNARMGRALQRLSHELYSRDSHFVLELVQVGGEELGTTCFSDNS